MEQWLSDQKIQYEKVDQNLYQIDDKLYLFIEGVEGKIIDEYCEFYFSTFEENILDLIDFVVFEFGERFYYSSPNEFQLNPLKNLGKSKDYNSSPFPFLGVHGKYEVLNGIGSYDLWCQKAKFLGYSTLAISETGTLAGAMLFQEACEKHGIKSILGHTAKVRSDFGDFEIKLLVKNKKGWRNLLHINKAQNVDNAGWIGYKDFLQKLEGLVVIVKQDFPLDRFIELPQENLYYQLDLTHWSSNEKDKEHLEAVSSYLRGHRDKIKPILCNDAYYVENGLGTLKKSLNKIGKVPFQYGSENQYMKTISEFRKDFVSLFNEFPEELFNEAIENAISVADSCNYKIPTNHRFLPQFPLTVQQKRSYKDQEGYLYHLVERGLQKISPDKDIDTYLERFEYEMGVIKEGGVIDYFLILADIADFCDREGILRGPGRGSAAGSLVAYLLNIVEVDPVEYNLLFERFLNPARLVAELPDIDMDFSDRDRVKRYLEQKYGLNYVASIGTYGTMKIKNAIKDFSRITNGISAKDANIITTKIPKQYENGGYVDVFKFAQEKESFKEFLQKHPKIFSDLEDALGAIRTPSIHACATIVVPNVDEEGFPVDIFDLVPVKKMGDQIVTEWEGKQLEKAGFLKEDILGLSQLEKFESIIDRLKKRGIEVDLYNLPLDDQRVYDRFSEGLTEDVFQFTTDGLKAFSKELKPENIEDIAAATALYRPATMSIGAHNQYVKKKHGEEEVVFDWGLEKTTEHTYGVLLYQEQMMEATRVIANFSLVEADAVRKAMGKKIKSLMDSYKDKFVDGAIKNGCDRDTALYIWDKIEKGSGYGFNKCVSGDTVFHKVGYCKKRYTPTIGEMYKIRSDYSYAKKVGKLPLHRKYKKCGYGVSFSMNEDGKLRKNKIIDIRYEGVRPVYRITTECGKTIKCTDNHNFPTSNGKKMLRDINIQKDLIYVIEHDLKYVSLSKIKDISLVGEEEVYDVEMDAPYHTFTTSEGIVTCNSHAVSYGMIAYWSQWLKVNYPLDFWAVSLQNSDEEERSKRIHEIEKTEKINLHPPDINKSGSEFTVDYESNSIYWNIRSIKYLGEAAIEILQEDRSINGRYFSLEEFIDRVPRKNFNKRTVTNLILSGCLDSIEGVKNPQDRLFVLRRYYELIKDPGIENFVGKFTDILYWQIAQYGLCGYGQQMAYEKFIRKHNIKGFVQSLENSNENDNVAVAGIVSSCNIRSSKKGDFASLTIDCNNVIIPVVLWNESYEKFKQEIGNCKGNVVICNGKVVDDAWRKQKTIHSLPNTNFMMI